MINDILTGKKALFADGVSTILRGQESRNRRVALLNGELVGNVRTESRGVNARVCKNGIYGFSSLAEYSEEAAEKVLKAATENAMFLGNHASRGLKPFPSYGTSIIPADINVVDFEQKKIIDFVKELDAYIAKTYPDLTSRTVVYAEHSMDKIIITSDACSGRNTNPRALVYVLMTALTKENTPVEIFESFGGYGSFGDYFNDFEWMKPEIDKEYHHIMDKKEGVYAQAGLKTVVLGSDLGGMLSHEAVGHTVECDLVKGGAISGKLLNQQVASELVTLTDYAYAYGDGKAPLPVFIDDEGTKAEDAVIIKDGILKGYMHNRETAAEYGVTPCGNARGYNFSDEPLIRMRNTAITPGKNTLEELIESVDDGYYLISSGNGQADLTGEFMFGVTMGYEIKNGKLGKAILDTTVSGVAFEMLKTVDMVSNNMTWSKSGTCGKKQPMPVSMGGPELRCKIMIGGR